MNTYLSSQWDAFFRDVWENIFSSEEELSELMDSDFFIEVVRDIYEYEKERVETLIKERDEKLDEEMKRAAGNSGLGAIARRIKKDLEFQDNIKEYLDSEILTDSVLAYEFLRNFHGQSIPEADALWIISSRYTVLLEFDKSLARRYHKLVESFLWQRNLRYQMRIASDQMIFEYNSAVLSMECFLRLKKFYKQSQAADVYEDFDRDIREMFPNSSESKLRSVMRTSSNLFECSANISSGKNGRTVGKIIEGYPEDFFPHETFRSLMLNFNKFLNDYPGLRHSGTSESKKRGLQDKDAILLSSLSALFSDYLLRK